MVLEQPLKNIISSYFHLLLCRIVEWGKGGIYIYIMPFQGIRAPRNERWFYGYHFITLSDVMMVERLLKVFFLFPINLTLSSRHRAPWGCATEQWVVVERPTCQTNVLAPSQSHCTPKLPSRSVLTFRFGRNPPRSPLSWLSVIANKWGTLRMIEESINAELALTDKPLLPESAQRELQTWRTRYSTDLEYTF